MPHKKSENTEIPCPPNRGQLSEVLNLHILKARNPVYVANRFQSKRRSVGKVNKKTGLIVNPTRRHRNYQTIFLQDTIHFKNKVLGKIKVLQQTFVEDKIKRVVREGETLGNVCRNIMRIARQIRAITLVNTNRVCS